jgi:hypothetical protein
MVKIVLATCFGLFIKSSSGFNSKDVYCYTICIVLKIRDLVTMEYEIEKCEFDVQVTVHRNIFL